MLRSVLWLGGLALGPIAYAGDVAPLMFFANSTRRDATVLEAQPIAKVRGCTAYFIRNSAGKVFVGSARHCFGGAISTWCQGGGAITRTDGIAGRCTRVVAADRNHDLAIVEASFPQPPLATLRLADYTPLVDTRLTMAGFPADKYRKGKLTVTENCWILKESVPSPHAGTWNDQSALHNCTTYGGNSGGPMIVEGTDVVVGLPFTYMPNDYTERDPNRLSTASHMAKMADFVSTFRRTLESEGIELVD